MRVLHGVLAFAVEIAMLAALGGWGFGAGDGVVGWLLGIGSVVAAIGVWSMWLAPKAMRPASRSVALGLKGVLFGGSAALLAVAGHGTAAIALAACGAVSVGLEVVLGPAGDAFEGLTP